MKPLISRPLRGFILLLLAGLAACSAKARPALDSDLYGIYHETPLTVVREGVVAVNPYLPRGHELECFPQRVVRNVAGLDFTSAHSAKEADFFRKIEVGEKILIHDIVRFEDDPGLWARATLEKDGTECLITATQGLKVHLLLTEAEIEQWQQIPEDIRTRMLAKEIKIGMTRAQVMIAWGPPYKQIQQTDASGAATESWVYQRGETRFVYLQFEGDRLTGWRE